VKVGFTTVTVFETENPPTDTVIVAVPGLRPTIVKLVLPEPCGIVTVAGTLATVGSLLVRFTAYPPVGAVAPVRPTPPVVRHPTPTVTFAMIQG
jgi:hypothetical protein